MMLSKTSAGSLTSWSLIFLLHFFMFLVFLITSNLPDLISLYIFCFFFCFRISFNYFLLAIFFSLNSRSCSRRIFLSSPFFFFSYHVCAGPLLRVVFVGLCRPPIFQERPLLFIPAVNLVSFDLRSSGSGNFS